MLVARIVKSNSPDLSTEIATTAAPRKTDALNAGSCLKHGDKLFSKLGCFYAIFQSDGNLAVYKTSGGFPLWHSGTQNQSGFYACVLKDGNFAIFKHPPLEENVLIQMRTNGKPVSFLVIRDDGQLVLVDSNRTTIYWTSRNTDRKCYDDKMAEVKADNASTEIKSMTKPKTDKLYAGNCLNPGDKLWSEFGCFYLVFEDDGNLAVKRTSGGPPLWITGIQNQGGCKACLLNDGNFVIYKNPPNENNILWQTKTSGKPVAYLKLYDSGCLYLYEIDNNSTHWTSFIVDNACRIAQLELVV